MTVASRATAAGTAEFRELACNRVDLRASFCHFRRIAELWCSSIALSVDAATADELLAAAAAYGINVVQTPLRDRDNAQRAAGRAIADGILHERFARDQLLVTALGGVMSALEPLSLGERLAQLEDRYLRSGLVAWSDLTPTMHCLAPRYLADEALRTCDNLGVGTIDVYLVDRPEMHLAHLPYGEFASRMRHAFAALEQLCADGKLVTFGIATADPSLSLSDLIGWAREVGGDAHHFRALQLPVGLSSTRALLDATQSRDGVKRSLLDAAGHHGLFTLAAHEPLDGATLQPFFRNELAGLSSDEQRALQFARSAPGVSTALVHPTDVFELQEAAEVARIPPVAGETIVALLQASHQS